MSWRVVFAGLILLGPSGLLAQGVTSNRVEASRVLGLETVSRIGSLDGPAAERFARVSGISFDPEQREVFVLDGLDFMVKVFSTEGEPLRAWGREGQGPGEFGSPTSIVFARDTVLVGDGDRVHFFTRDGETLRSITPRTALRVTWIRQVAADELGWKATFSEIEPGVTGSTPFRRSYRLDPIEGVQQEWVHQDPHPGSGPTGILAHLSVSSHHGSGIIEAGSPGYGLTIFDENGDRERRVVFIDAPVRVPSSARRDYERTKRTECAQTTQGPLCLKALEDYLSEIAGLPLPATRPVVGRVLGSSQGWVLVQRADLDPDPFDDESAGPWDLVRDTGDWIGRLPLPERFEPRWLGDGLIWGVERDDLDVPYVVGLRWYRRDG